MGGIRLGLTVAAVVDHGWRCDRNQSRDEAGNKRAMRWHMVEWGFWV
jgi:hypothetical protein